MSGTGDSPASPAERRRNLRAAWYRKFHDAGDGIRVAIRTQTSVWVHLAFTAAVAAVGGILRIEAWRWSVLILCIALVIALEMVNTAVEQLVRALSPGPDPQLRTALHLAAGAVLVATVGAVIVGLIVLLPPLLEFVSQWVRGTGDGERGTG